MRFEFSIDEIKHLIVSTLAFEDLSPADIPDDVSLFGGGLGLDSVDALELCMALQNRFNLRLGEEAGLMERLDTPRRLAAFISSLLSTEPCEAQ